MSIYDVPDRADEPTDDLYVTASCNHEVYNGELLFTWDNETLCSECVEEKFDNLFPTEKARLLGCEWWPVSLRHARINF